MTADEELVILHDSSLDRTARGPADDCTGGIDTRTLAQVVGCDAGTWFNEAHPERAAPAFAEERIPSLDDVLDRFGTDVRWYIETKKLLAGEGMEEALVTSLEAAGFTADATVSQHLVIQSFDARSVRRVGELRPDITLAQHRPELAGRRREVDRRGPRAVSHRDPLHRGRPSGDVPPAGPRRGRDHHQPTRCPPPHRHRAQPHPTLRVGTGPRGRTVRTPSTGRSEPIVAEVYQV